SLKVEESHKHLLQIADRLEVMSEQITLASDNLAVQIGESNQGASTQALRLSEAATAMNQMNVAVQEVAQNASQARQASEETRNEAIKGAKIVDQAAQSITTTKEATLALQENMQELDGHAVNISKIMGFISDIADQTNLLALNAAIEAARAGDAGRGFAVVADEVRKLAEKTMDSTQDVGNATKAIQESVKKSMVAMHEAAGRLEEALDYAVKSGQALTDIVNKAASTTDQVTLIATSAEEQSATSDQINDSISEVNELSSQNAKAMDEASLAVKQLTKQMQDLNNLMTEMRA
ncbi:MAG: hypothetical protein IJU40_01560, partial [Desulfovibrionaceae bacterium]|nr:hypothetical protein [Desulfovibrionaceae bacterium]